jgi:hypothetical protein
VVEQPDLGIAYGRYRLAEFPALAVLDPGGALVDTVTITPHSEAWVHAFLATLAEAHARTAAWVHPHPPPPRLPHCEPPAVVEVPQFNGAKARPVPAPKPSAPVDARTAIRAKLALRRAKLATQAKLQVQPPPAKPAPKAMLAPIRR